MVCKLNHLNSNTGQAEQYSLSKPSGQLFKHIFTRWTDENYFCSTAAVTPASPHLLNVSTSISLHLPSSTIERLFIFLLKLFTHKDLGGKWRDVGEAASWFIVKTETNHMSPIVLGKAGVYPQSYGIWQLHSSISGGYSFQSHCTHLPNPSTEELFFFQSNKGLVIRCPFFLISLTLLLYVDCRDMWLTCQTSNSDSNFQF